MALRIKQQELDKSSVKSKQKELMSSINSGKQELQDIEANVVNQKKVIKTAEEEKRLINKELEAVKKEIRNKRNELNSLNVSISNKKKNLFGREKILKDAMDLEKIRIAGVSKTARQKIKEMEAVVVSLESKVKSLTDELNLRKVDVSELESKDERLTDEIRKTEATISWLNTTVELKENILAGIEKKIAENNEIHSKVEELLKTRVEVEKDLLSKQEAIRLAVKEFGGVEEDKTKRLIEVNKREEQNKIATNNLLEREHGFDMREAELKRLATTLQKHLDKLEIPIKVI